MSNENEYTPTTEEIARAYCDWDTSTFDRWLAAHDAEVAAKALEDAADVALLDRWNGWKWVAVAVSDWLRDRATNGYLRIYTAASAATREESL